jgi:hypothetical protein
MGAAVSLQSAAFVPQIEGVVAEGSFRNLREVTFDYAGLQQSAFLGKTLFRLPALVAIWIAQTQGGFRFGRLSGKGGRQSLISSTSHLRRERPQNPLQTLRSDLQFSNRPERIVERARHRPRASH